MSISPRQLIPRLRKLLQDMGLHCVGNHSFPPGNARVDLYLPGDPPMVVHRCDRPVLAGSRALSRHREPIARTGGAARVGTRRSSGFQPAPAPLVFVLLKAAPVGTVVQHLAEESIEYAVLDQTETTEDGVKALAGRIRDYIESVRHQRNVDRIGTPGAAGRRNVGGSYVRPPQLQTLTGRLDKLRRDCGRLVLDHAAAQVERELELAEDEITHDHYPACVLHLARAAEALVLHLADRWDARPDVHRLSEVRALQDGVLRLANKLDECESDDRASTHAQRTRPARREGVRLVERIMEMLFERAESAEADDEAQRTILSALGDINRRWGSLKEVRPEIKATKEDPRFALSISLRNAIAHARPFGRNEEFGAQHVHDMIEGVHALVEHLGTMRDAIAPHLPPAFPATPRS